MSIERNNIDSTDRLIGLIEDERHRIARDLHDGPAQTLTNISMRIGLINSLFDNRPELAKDELQKISTRVSEAVNEIRRIMYDLRPVSIEELGLVEAVRQRVSRIRADWDVQLDFDSNVECYLQQISLQRQISIYRVVCEILNNARKHSDASRIEVIFRERDSSLVIEIGDNGIGFDVNNIPSGHYGVIGMKERVTLIGGTLELSSAKDQGSRYSILIPFEAKQ